MVPHYNTKYTDYLRTHDSCMQLQLTLEVW